MKQASLILALFLLCSCEEDKIQSELNSCKDELASAQSLLDPSPPSNFSVFSKEIELKTYKDETDEICKICSQKSEALKPYLSDPKFRETLESKAKKPFSFED